MKTIKVHNKQYDITYVYEYSNYWDKEKKQSRSKRRLIGRLDPFTGETVPTDGRMRKAKDVESKIQITEDVDIVPVEYSRKYYGATYLLEAISEKTKVTEYLQQYFPKQYKQILSIAFYIILGKSRALCNFDQFDAHTKHPYNRNITSQRSSELFMSISQEGVYNFVKELWQHHLEDEYSAFDSTSFSSYSEKLKQVKYGFNKENDKIAQINFALVFCSKSNIPLYFRKLAGNIPDSKAVKGTLADLFDHGFKRLKLVMDKGNFTIENINLFIENEHDFLLPPKLQMKFVQKELNAIIDSLSNFEYYNIEQNVYSTTVPHDWDYYVASGEGADKIKKSKQLYMHFYFNPVQREKDVRNFNRKLYYLYEELLNKHKKGIKILNEKYFKIINNESDSIIVPNEAEIKNSMKYFGYMVLLGSEPMNSITALEIYRNKDVIEKAFGTVKEKQGFRRVLVSNEKSFDGKLFVEYISLILLSYLKKQMQISKLNRKYTMEKIFTALDSIECYELLNKKIRYSEILDKQKKIYWDLGVQPPA